MRDWTSLLSDAKQLSVEDQIRLVDALWKYFHSQAKVPLNKDWEPELQKRMADLEKAAEETVSWESIRDAALKRID